MAIDATNRSVWFTRSMSTDVDYYRIDQQQDAGSWSTIAYVYAAETEWSYQCGTGILDDLSDYGFRVIPVDACGSVCASPLELGAEKVVRTPDTVDFDVEFNAGATTLTFSGA